jgi:hypothetical protein
MIGLMVALRLSAIQTSTDSEGPFDEWGLCYL